MSRLRRKNNASSSSRRGSDGSPAAKKSKKTIDLGWSGANDDDDDHIHSSDDSDVDYGNKQKYEDDDDDDVEEEETLDAKKVRLAREYLRKLERDDDDEDGTSSSDEGSSDEDDGEDGQNDYDRISHKLQHERLKLEGTLERAVADKVYKNITQITSSMKPTASAGAECTTTQSDWINSGYIKLCKGHDLTPTCVTLCGSNGEYAVSGSKDHSVFIWDVERGQRMTTIADTWKKSHDDSTTRTSGAVLSVACSDDGRYCAVGKRDATVCIYDIRTANNNSSKKSAPLVKTFTGHKGAVTSLAFRTQSLQLFSGSDDRCIR